MSNLKISERFTVDAPVEIVWSFLIDPVQVAACLPGAKLDGQEGADTYLGVMKLKVGPVSTEFRGKATLSEVNVGERTLLLTGTGEDKGGGSSARLTMRCGVQPAAAGGADVSVDADVEMAGKLVRFGRGMIEGVSKQLFKQFVERARTRLTAAGKAEAPLAAAEAWTANPDPSAAPVAALAPSLAEGSAPEQTAPASTGASAAKPEPTPPLVPSPSDFDRLSSPTPLPLAGEAGWGLGEHSLHPPSVLDLSPTPPPPQALITSQLFEWWDRPGSSQAMRAHSDEAAWAASFAQRESS